MKTWAEVTKMGITETIKSSLNKTQFSIQDTKQNAVNLRRNQKDGPNDLNLHIIAGADFIWEDFDED